jgi:hypothetical protein
MTRIKSNRCDSQSAFLLILVSLLSLSCGGNSKTTAAASSAAGVVFDTTSLDFGAVAVGTSKQATVTVTNSTPSGGDTLTVTRIVVSGTGFSLVAPGSSFSLAPGQSTTVGLNFAPAASGNAVGQVSLYLAGNPDSRKISLRATTIAGNRLTISPSPISFGTVTLGRSKSLPVTLSAATSAVTISSASWSGQGYSISGIDFPITIPANSSVTASCNFAPQEAGTVSGQVIFVSDAANSTTSETFSGTGAAPPISLSKVI